jgi:hypothetical protein
MENWQKRVLTLVGSIPEPSGAGALVHNSMSKIVLNVEGPNTSVAEQIQHALSGFDLGRAGELMWLVGEIFPSWSPDGDDDVAWEIYSPAEVEASKGKATKIENLEGKFEELPSDHSLFRMWRPDPARRILPWSAHKAQLHLLEAMYLHQLADTAVATSRLAGAGLLYWPTNLPSLPVVDGKPEQGSQEELQFFLQRAMTDSITDRNAADAIVPMIVFGDPTTGENQKPEHILLERPDDAAAFASRMNAYRQRYATGVELPIESVTGMGPANHWTAWIVKEDKWRFYLAPLTDLLVRGLTRNFVAPMAQELDTGATGYRIVADGSALTAKPDKTESAIRLAQLGGYLSDDAVREATGFSEDDAGDGVRTNTNRFPELPAQFRDTSPAGG